MAAADNVPPYSDVLTFWFEEAGAKAWFKKSDRFDETVRERFTDTWNAARQGECWTWRESPAGRCAEIIVLDQFSRNMFRDDGRAFAQDNMALTLAQWAVQSGQDQHMDAQQRYFTYMPYMHSESLVVHAEAERLFTALGNENALHYEYKHQEVLRRFGRYPGRNAALHRKNSAAEQRYLDEGGGF